MHIPRRRRPIIRLPAPRIPPPFQGRISRSTRRHVEPRGRHPRRRDDIGIRSQSREDGPEMLRRVRTGLHGSGKSRVRCCSFGSSLLLSFCPPPPIVILLFAAATVEGRVGWHLRL